MKLNTRCNDADAPVKMTCSFFTLILLVSYSAPVTTNVFIAGCGTSGVAAGVLAALAIIKGVGISGVPVREVQNTLLDAGGYLLPYLDVPRDHEWFK